MMEIAIVVAVFLAGVLAGVIGLGQWEVWRMEKEAAERKAKARYSAQKSAATRKKKAAEKFEPEPAKEPVDINMYGRKANGEGTWPA